MKITELDLQTEGKRYKYDNTIFTVKDGDLVDIESNTYLRKENISITELLKLDFEEIKKSKNPYARVNNRENYYSIVRDGSIRFIHEDRLDYDNRVFSTANYFNNKEYAEYIAFKETLMRRLDRFAWEHNAKAIDWDDSCSAKYYIEFSNTRDELIIDWNCSDQSNNVYFTSKEIAKKAVEKFKDDLIKLYTWEFDF